MIKSALIMLFYPALIMSVVFAITLFGLKHVPDISQFESDRFVSIYAGHDIEQSFISTNAGLNSILIFLKNRLLTNTQDLSFYLQDDSGQVIRTINISGRNIGDGEPIRFQFPSIPNSKDKKYTIVLSTTQTTTSQVPIQVGFSNSDTYLSGSSQDASQPGDMTFQTFYQPLDHGAQLTHLFSDWSSKFLSSRLIGTAFLIGLLFTVSAKALGFRYN